MDFDNEYIMNNFETYIKHQEISNEYMEKYFKVYDDYNKKNNTYNPYITGKYKNKKNRFFKKHSFFSNGTSMIIQDKVKEIGIVKYIIDYMV